MSDNEQEMAKKRKMAPILPSTERCKYFLPRKKRLCKMTATITGFCAEHTPMTTTADTSNDVQDQDRIPCPLDSKHTVYRKNLRKHLKICNARVKSDLPDYIEKNINSGEVDADSNEDFSKIKLHELADDELDAILQKVTKIYKQHIENKIETVDSIHMSMEDEITKARDNGGKDSLKHLTQVGGLLGLLETEKHIEDSTSFVEFGAGKGQLSFYLARLLEQKSNCQIILLDRMSLRHKKENKIEDKSLTHRIRVDIADFRMQRLELLKDTKSIVAISKHLCGGATDLTLRCVTETTDEATNPTEFIMIALCCHHRCDWKSYVGKKFFTENGISEREFTIITKLASWAICGTGMSRERRQALEKQEVIEQNTNQRIPLATRNQYGLICKRAIDYGRIDYLKSRGYEAKLKFYVPVDVTLENVCLLAKKQQGNNE